MHPFSVSLSRYTIITKTSDIRGAGTDANVSAMLFGDKANTPLFMLENSKNNFEKGETDEFVVETIDIGVIKKLQIGHDNKGLAAAWHLDNVEVIHQVLRASSRGPRCFGRGSLARTSYVNPKP